MLVQELERPLAVDLVVSVEEFDVGTVAEAEHVVQAADFGVFVGNPFVGSDAVPVAAFDHERARGEQRDHLGVVEHTRCYSPSDPSGGSRSTSDSKRSMYRS